MVTGFGSIENEQNTVMGGSTVEPRRMSNKSCVVVLCRTILQFSLVHGGDKFWDVSVGSESRFGLRTGHDSGRRVDESGE